MKNLRLYIIGTICIIGAGAWLLVASRDAETKTNSSAEPGRAAKLTEKGAPETVATTPRPAVKSLASPSSMPVLTTIGASSEQPKKVYKNPADDPANWSDFQAAIYAYKDDVLGPNIKKCWHTVSGNGRIVATHQYEVVNGIARPTMVSLEPGTSPVPEITITQDDEALSDAEIETALACLRAAAMDTEFHFVGLQGETDLNDTFTGHWGWRTPEALKERAEKRRMNAQK